MFDTRKQRFAIAGAIAATAVTAAVIPMGMAVAGDTKSMLEADLKGRAEVAAGATNNRIVGDPNGRGEASVSGVAGAPSTLCYELTVDKIAMASGAHIHEAAVGTNGDIVVFLAPPADGTADGCLTQLDSRIVSDILADPEDYYVNVHNAEYPGGAIRGQLSAER